MVILNRLGYVLNAIKRAYHIKYGKYLPIYGVNEKDIANFVTYESDKKKGSSRIPDASYRLIDHDTKETFPISKPTTLGQLSNPDQL